MQFQFQRKRLNEISESKILEELEKAAKHFKYIEYGRRDFDKIPNIEVSSSCVRKHFNGSWTKALDVLKNHLQKKGLDLSPRPHAPNQVHSDKDLFNEMERVWQKVGQRPSRTEWEMSEPKISYNCYKQRFGGWVLHVPNLLSIKWVKKFWQMISFYPSEKIQKHSSKLRIIITRKIPEIFLLP